MSESKMISMPTLRIATLAIVLASFPSHASAQGGVSVQIRPDPRQMIPVAIRGMKIHVGVDTIGGAEHKMGKGLAVTGAHPQGARLWKLSGNEGYIQADGFDYKNGKPYKADPLVIASLTIRDDNPHPLEWKNVPTISHAFPIRFDNHPFHLGMSYQKVSSLLGQSKQANKNRKLIRLQRTGFVRINRNTTYSHWTIDFYFANHRLDAVEVNCE